MSERAAAADRLGELLTERPDGLRFSEYLDLVLYDPEVGFYEVAGRAGSRSGDFITSVETGTLFAALIGEWLDRRWDDAGRPQPFRVAEVGAGVGTLWRGIQRARPRCLPDLAYTLVERAAAQRAAHAELPGSPGSSAQLPAGGPLHVILANELLDNLGVDLAVTAAGGWRQLVLRADPGSTTASAMLVPGDLLDPEYANRLPSASGLPEGSTLPLPVGADAWLAEVTARGQVVLCLDYAATTDELLNRGMTGWLRTYDGHRRGGDPLADPGTRDITHDVPVDLLDPQPVRTMSQARFLTDLGIAARVDQARATWEERRHLGDLEAMFARSAIGEAEALVDPAGLGGFVAMEWRQNGG
ncbi:MAG: SAM-dependent methyltransferase [Actinomycetota bacterium]